MRHARTAVSDVVAVRALQPAYRVSRRLRAAHRPAMRAFDSGLRFRHDALAWSDDQRRAWTLQQLRQVLRTAGQQLPFYAEWFKSAGFDAEADFDFSDFAELPALDRGDIRRAGGDLLAPSVPKGQLRRDATGGSSGEPTRLWLGPEERGWRESGREHFMRRIGLPAGSSAGYLWGHHLDPVGSDRPRDRARFALENIRWFDCFRLSDDTLDRYHDQLCRWQPRSVVAYASALGALAERMRERGVEQPPYPRCCFVTGAEKLLPRHREAVTEVFGKPVHERYGSRDVGLMGFQTDPDRSLAFTVDWVNVLVEPESADPESAVLITKLHADAMPMIRYRVGDIARFPAGSRPGQPALRLEEVLGRDTDRIRTGDGGWVHGIFMPHLMKDFPVTEFQLEQSADLSVAVRIVPAADFAPEDVAAIQSRIEENLPGVPIAVHSVRQIPRNAANKWRPVISHAPQPGSSSSRD